MMGVNFLLEAFLYKENMLIVCFPWLPFFHPYKPGVGISQIKKFYGSMYRFFFLKQK